MRTSLILILFFVWFQPQDLIIKEIKAGYSKIKNSQSQYTKSTRDLTELSTEGGTATYYKDSDGKVKLITIEFYGESGKFYEEYYFNNDSLFFVYSEEHRYNVPFYVDSADAAEMGGESFDSRKTKIEQQRYYFSKNKLIQWLNPKLKSVSKDDAYFEKEKHILDFCKLLLK